MDKAFKLLFLLLCTTMFMVGQAQVSIYVNDVNSWHKQREISLTASNGWVNLAGLFWLKEGKNSFGSAPNNDIVFNSPDMPALAGYFELKENTVTWTTAKGSIVTIKDSSIEQAMLFQKGSFRAPLVSLGHFRWNIIQREDKIGVRFRDLESEAVKKFPGIKRYPVDSTWRIPATLEVAVNNTLAITNVLGQTNNQNTPGKLVFTIGHTVYRLDALEETPGELFIIFGDATSGKETYPSGRFLYAKKPKAGEVTFIDFNKAFNPPCAFSKYATCPLPPKQNILPIAITAGEKLFGEEH